MYLYKKLIDMRFKLLISLVCFAILTSCNNSSDKEAKKEDTSQHASDHDHSDHTSGPGVTVPDLPAVPEGARVYFKNLKKKSNISSPFLLEMGAEGIKVDTAGPVVAGSGHHHLFIDAEDSLAAGATIPADSLHIHFGKGQTRYELKLTPGVHKLTLQMADGLHRSYGSKLSATVIVNVK